MHDHNQAALIRTAQRARDALAELGGALTSAEERQLHAQATESFLHLIAELDPQAPAQLGLVSLTEVLPELGQPAPVVPLRNAPAPLTVIKPNGALHTT